MRVVTSTVLKLCVAALLGLVMTISAAANDSEPQHLDVRVKSALLTQFAAAQTAIEARVLLPDSYYKEPERRYPVLYWIEGFGGGGQIDVREEIAWEQPMRELHEEFIIVFLNGMYNGGHQEFADSVNFGPWGSALTSEFIPVFESTTRTIGTPQTRFVGGHSSGGWSALWLQITYPNLFGGEWSLSPDPVDFRNFSGPDLTRSPPQNFFKDGDGHDYVIDGRPMRDFVVQPGWEAAQFASFEAVFGPRDDAGNPKPLFDRKSGAIDADVAQYWERHYDIARILRENWTALAPELRGKLHIVVGTRDQFGLMPAVALLATELRDLGSDAEVEFVSDADHSTVFEWRGGAFFEIIREASRMARGS